MITGLQDLTAGDSPSALFYILADKLSYLLDTNAEITISPKGVKRRRKVNFVIKTFGPLFLSNPQIFENRNFLQNPDCSKVPPDSKIVLPSEPVIWASNHGFKDDTLASVTQAEALQYVNWIRERAYADAPGDGAHYWTSLSLSDLQNERCRELYQENVRRTDLIRWGLWTTGYTWEWKGGVASGTNLPEYTKCFPIPTRVMTASNFRQTAGY